MPFYVAKEAGLYEKAGVKVEFIAASSAAERDQIMAAGQADGMVNDLLATALFNRQSAQVQVVRFAQVATAAQPNFRLVASPQSGIKSVKDLAGVEIGISQASIIDYITYRMLTGEGLKPDQIKTLAVPKIPDRMALLSDGRFEGRQLPVTVLMLDTCQFTSVSERLSPGELLAWLNRGMALFVPAITRRGGMVNKFTGDGLLAVFGAPLSSGEEADAKAAIDAALAIQRAVASLNEELQREGLPAMGLRIGVHSGPVLAGSMGSSERLEYAVIGDAVNCAARLESLDKERQTNLCRVLVSSTTEELLPKGLPLEWLDWG